MARDTLQQTDPGPGNQPPPDVRPDAPSKPRTTTAPRPLPPHAKPPGRTTATANSVQPKPVTLETRRDSGLAWLVLLGLLAMAAAPLLIEIGRPAAVTPIEARTLATSIETRLRKTPLDQADSSLRAWTPVYGGKTRVDQPPGVVWLHQTAFAGTHASQTTEAQYKLRARLASAALALLTVAALFWAGHSIGGLTTGVLTALVAMTMPLLVGLGRIATPDSAVMGLTALSAASALWAMRPLRSSPTLARQLVGWVGCGVSLGLAILTGGPVVVPPIVIPIILLAMVCPRRVGHVLGIAASLCIAALLVTPWALHAHETDPTIGQQWLAQLRPDLMRDSGVGYLRDIGWRLWVAAIICGPWLIWLVPAVTQPFSTSTGESRRRMLLGWVWLISAAALVTLAPGPANITGLLQLTLPAALAIGLVMQQFHDLSAEGRHARLWLVCRWLIIVLTTVLAIALPLLGYLMTERPEMVDWLPRPDQPLLAVVNPLFYAGAGLALLLTALLGAQFALGNHPGRSTACWAVWMLITMSLATIPIARGPMLSIPSAPPAYAAPSPGGS